MSADLAVYLLWLVWLASWVAAMPWSAPVAKRAGLRREWLSRLVTIAGAILLFGLYSPRQIGLARLWQMDGERGWIMAALVAAGFVFSWWARIHLGRLWSGTVARKGDHHIVESGPYRLVRHPIYSGLILATLATGVELGTVVTLAGAGLMVAGFFLKARLEEEFLREELGADAYDTYARKTAMLLPYLRF